MAKENRTELIGIRFTKTERKIIETLSNNRDLTLTEFVRTCMFSHINHLEEDIGILSVDFFMKQFGVITGSIEKISECITIMKKEFDIFDLKRIKHNLGIYDSVKSTNQSKAKSNLKI